MKIQVKFKVSDVFDVVGEHCEEHEEYNLTCYCCRDNKQKAMRHAQNIKDELVECIMIEFNTEKGTAKVIY